MTTVLPVVSQPYHGIDPNADTVMAPPPKRRRRRNVHHTPDFLVMLQRMLAAAGARVASADPEQLAELVALSDHLDAAIWVAVQGQRETSITWQYIGDATGTTRQAAIQKWGPGAKPPRLIRPKRR